MIHSTTRAAWPVAALILGLAATMPVAAPSWAASHARLRPAARTTAREPDVQARITELHQKLKIRPDQEAAFNDVAQIMRDNAARMKDLRTSRAQSEQSMTAVDTLHAYASVIDAHADGVHKLVPAFETLYDTMSADQRKVADRVFREKVREASRRGRS